MVHGVMGGIEAKSMAPSRLTSVWCKQGATLSTDAPVHHQTRGK